MVIPKKKYPRSTDRNLIKRRIRAALEPLRKESPPFIITVRTQGFPPETPFTAYKNMGDKVMALCTEVHLEGKTKKDKI